MFLLNIVEQLWLNVVDRVSDHEVEDRDEQTGNLNDVLTSSIDSAPGVDEEQPHEGCERLDVTVTLANLLKEIQFFDCFLKFGVECHTETYLLDAVVYVGLYFSILQSDTLHNVFDCAHKLLDVAEATDDLV